MDFSCIAAALFTLPSTCSGILRQRKRTTYSRPPLRLLPSTLTASLDWVSLDWVMLPPTRIKDFTSQSLQQSSNIPAAHCSKSLEYWLTHTSSRSLSHYCTVWKDPQFTHFAKWQCSCACLTKPLLFVVTFWLLTQTVFLITAYSLCLGHCASPHHRPFSNSAFDCQFGLVCQLCCNKLYCFYVCLSWHSCSWIRSWLHM